MIFDGLVSDLDGVVYTGNDAIPGAPEAIARLRAGGVRIVFCTNQSRTTMAQYVARLNGLGIPAEASDLVTSPTVTAEELERRGYSGAKAIVLGGAGLREALACAGVEIDDEGSRADIVVTGLDFDFDYAALRRAALAVRAGAQMFATNDDPAYLQPDGLWPGAGSILAALETATGGKAEVMGKPHRPMMEAAARRLAGLDRIVLVGDSLATDIAGAHAMGWPGILVLSGVTSREAAAAADPPPELVLESIAELERETTAP
jgi:HAD superfamily hydrolase (TIGR01450 family)